MTKTTDHWKQFRGGWTGTSRYVNIFNPNPAESIVQMPFTTALVKDSVTKGGGLPNWRYLIGTIQSATTPLTGTRYRYSQEPGSITRVLKPVGSDPFQERYYNRGTGYFFRLGFPPAASGDLLTNANNRAMIKWLQRARQAQVALQTGVVLGEIGETLRFIKSPAQTLRRSLDDYLRFLRGKRGRLKKREKRRFLSDSWLEWNYAAGPLMSDIEAGFEALSRIADFPFPYQRISAKGKETSATTSVEHFDESQVGFGVRFKIRDMFEGSVKYYGVIYMDNQNAYEFSNRNTRNLGFDTRSFVPTVWELIPYSFLVDYFTNIGDCLEAWSFWQANIRWLAKGQSLKARREPIDARVHNVSPLETLVLTSNLGSHVSELETLIRSDMTGIALMPRFEFEVPGMSSRKWLNMAALARAQRSLLPF